MGGQEAGASLGGEGLPKSSKGTKQSGRGSLLDVFDRMVIDYHLGLFCTAVNAARVSAVALDVGLTGW